MKLVVNIKENRVLAVLVIAVVLVAIVIARLIPGGEFYPKLTFIVGFLLCTASIIAYSFDFRGGTLKSFISMNRYAILIILTIVGVFSPILTDNFYYYDEYWVFPGHDVDMLRTGVALGRYFQGLLSSIFSFVNPMNISLIRKFSVFCAILFGLILYKWMLKKSKNDRLSFLVAVSISASSAMADCTSYAAILSYPLALMLASFSVVLFEGAIEAFHHHKVKTFVMMFYSAGMIIATYHSYQLAITAIFLMFAIDIYFSEDRKRMLKSFFCYCSMLASITIVYYFTLNIIGNVMDVTLNNRSGMIKNLEDVSNKIRWFVGAVLPGAIDRVVTCFGGRSIVSNKSYGYYVNYKTFHGISFDILRYIAVACIMSMMIGFVVRKKRIIELLLLLAMIPSSYFVYLILAENGYLTYYAFPLISIIMLYTILGIYQILKWAINNKKQENELINYVLAIMTLCLIFQSNIYMRQYWVKENETSYLYLKNTIATSIMLNDNKKIHVYGVPNFGQANVYSVFATNLVLHELGKDPNDYEITVSDKAYYLSVIEKQVFENAKKNLTTNEAEKLESYYVFEPTYSQFHLNLPIAGQEQLVELKSLFEKSNMLPTDFRDVTTVNLTWVTGTW